MKKSFVLVILLVALVAFSVVYKKSRDKRMNSARLVGAPMRELLLPELPVGEVREIRVKEGTAQLNLAVQDNRWIVKERSGYAASIDVIKRAVDTLSVLKIQGKNVVGPSALAELKLLPPTEGSDPKSSGVQVELMNEKGDVLASFVAGDVITTTGGASGPMGGPTEQRYVRIPKDENTVWIVSEPLMEWQTDAKEWIDKSFIAVKDIKTVAVTHVVPANSWAAERKDIDSPFTLIAAANGESLDTAKTTALNTLLANATFTDVLPKDQVKPDFFKDGISAKLTTFEGFTYDIKLLVVQQPGQNPESVENCFFTFDVSANIPKERKPAADEKPEDKAKNDEAFTASTKALEEKLAKEKSLAGWVFNVSAFNVDALGLTRSDVLRDTSAPAPATGGPSATGNAAPQSFMLPGVPMPAPSAPAPAPQP